MPKFKRKSGYKPPKQNNSWDNLKYRLDIMNANHKEKQEARLEKRNQPENILKRGERFNTVKAAIGGISTYGFVKAAQYNEILEAEKMESFAKAFENSDDIVRIGTLAFIGLAGLSGALTLKWSRTAADLHSERVFQTLPDNSAQAGPVSRNPDLT